MMNKEVAKAMNKKENKANAIKKWWNKNGYKVMRVVLFPVWWGIQTKEKITLYLNSREEWSEERVKKSSIITFLAIQIGTKMINAFTSLIMVMVGQ